MFVLYWFRVIGSESGPARVKTGAKIQKTQTIRSRATMTASPANGLICGGEKGQSSMHASDFNFAVLLHLS